MQRVAVIGAGSWGTTVASIAAMKSETRIWARRTEVADAINATRRNPDYQSEYELPAELSATHDLEAAVSETDLVIMAVPSHGFREVYAKAAEWIPEHAAILSLTKGIEEGTLATMTEVMAELDTSRDVNKIGMLTGPNLAAEIMAGHPTAAVVAMPGAEAALAAQEALIGPTFRVYTNDDVVGCELGGAMKNVMAIAAGMSDGLGFGDNTRATLITRALAELTRLGVARGGRANTFAGLAGMGDLIATCSSSLSRNHRVGVAMAEGKSLEQIISEMRMVAEGVKTTRGVLGLAEQSGVEMPIAEHVGQVLYEGVAPRDAVLSLMTREAKAEHE